MRHPVFSWHQQVHELPLAADGTSCFAETRNVSVFESFALETLRRQPRDGGPCRNGGQIQPGDVSLKFRPGLK